MSPADARTRGVRWESSVTRTRCVQSYLRGAWPVSGQREISRPARYSVRSAGSDRRVRRTVRASRFDPVVWVLAGKVA